MRDLDFDLDLDLDLDGIGIGLTLDDLDLDLDIADLPSLDRQTRHRSEWWETTEDESHFLDLPTFDSASHRARHMVERMARQTLANAPSGVTDDDPVLPYQNRFVSLHELLADMDARELSILLGPDGGAS